MADERKSTENTDGQVSEVSGMDGEPDEISSEDTTSGSPTGESGKVQEGSVGPNAVPRHEAAEPAHD